LHEATPKKLCSIITQATRLTRIIHKENREGVSPGRDEEQNFVIRVNVGFVDKFSGFNTRLVLLSFTLSKFLAPASRAWRLGGFGLIN
jgi:hypothetical protein